MPTQIFGIDNLKKFVLFACGFTQQVAKSLEDGKFSWNEGFGFLDEAMEIPGLVKSWDKVKQELLELSPEERQELYDYLQTEFDIPNENLEAAVEHAVQWVLNTLALYEMFKAVKNNE